MLKTKTERQLQSKECVHRQDTSGIGWNKEVCFLLFESSSLKRQGTA